MGTHGTGLGSNHCPTSYQINNRLIFIYICWHEVYPSVHCLSEAYHVILNFSGGKEYTLLGLGLKVDPP